MWPDTSENRLIYIHRHQAELRAEAAANRLAPRRRAGTRTYRIRGLHLQIGTLLIVVGRSLCDEERRRPAPAR